MVKIIRIFALFIGTLFVIIIFYPVSSQRLDNSKLQSIKILDTHGSLLREVLSDAQGRGVWVPIDKISASTCSITVAIEDKRFYHHFGIDPIAILRAGWTNIRHRRIVSGGSTITQQLARHIYRLPHHWSRKPLEALLAIRLEIYLSKRQILEQYLNRLPYGNQLFGIEAASRTYLDKPARDLSWFESAFLVGLPQAPERYNPYKYPERARLRFHHILSLLRQRGWINDSDYQAAIALPPKIVHPERKFNAPHFCQMIIAQKEKIAIGQDHQIFTTLDGTLQAKIARLAADHIRKLAKQNVSNAAVIVLENATNSVKAWLGSIDFFDAGHNGEVDGVLALRQPGSAIKPFTYGLALENGYSPADILPDIETYAATAGGDFKVHNYDEKYHGPVRLRTALACSYNVATVRLLQSLGTELLLEKLKLAGLISLNKPASYYGLGLTLGNGEVTLRDLTNAYAALAREGRLAPILFIQQNSSQMLQAQPDSAAFIFSPRVAFLLSDILSDPVARAPAFGLGAPLRLPFACAVKTGTTKDFRDNWTIGYTRDYTVGVWVGNFDGQPMQKISGITGAAPLFRDIMLILHEKKYPANFTPPKGLERINICAASGRLPTPHCPGVIQEWFLSGTPPRKPCDVHRMVNIDSRTGMPANSKTPKMYRKNIICEFWPAEYRTWMEAVGLTEPPQSLAANIEEESSFKVAFPDDGDIFKIDPILRRDYQNITCKAIVPRGISTIEWIIDDSIRIPVHKPFQLLWNLQPGEHTLQIKASRRGQYFASKVIRYCVYE